MRGPAKHKESVCVFDGDHGVAEPRKGMRPIDRKFCPLLLVCVKFEQLIAASCCGTAIGNGTKGTAKHLKRFKLRSAAQSKTGRVRREGG